MNEEEASLFDMLWLLLASVIFVPLFQKIPGGNLMLYTPCVSKGVGVEYINYFCIFRCSFKHENDYLFECRMVACSNAY